VAVADRSACRGYHCRSPAVLCWLSWNTLAAHIASEAHLRLDSRHLTLVIVLILISTRALRSAHDQTLTPAPAGHVIASAAFGTLGYALYYVEQRQ